MAIRRPGSSTLSPKLIADQLQIPLQEPAGVAGVHRNTIRRHPDSPRLQALLRRVRRVLSAAAALHPGLGRAWFLIMNAPIPELQRRTLLTVIATRPEEAVTYLHAVWSGFSG